MILSLSDRHPIRRRIKGTKTAAEALKKIMDSKSLCSSAAVTNQEHMSRKWNFGRKAGIKPAGSWYAVYEKGAEGNVPTLKYTDQKEAYTVIDRATYLSIKDQIKLAVLVEGDEALLNFISLIPVNSAKCPKVNTKDTKDVCKMADLTEKRSTDYS